MHTDPWQPEVGQRVRVQLDPACTFVVSWQAKDRTIERRQGHMATEDGRLGVVEPCPYETTRDGCALAKDGHPVVVRFDSQLHLPGVTKWFGHYASSELIPA